MARPVLLLTLFRAVAYTLTARATLQKSRQFRGQGKAVVAEGGLFSDLIGFHNLLYDRCAELRRHGRRDQARPGIQGMFSAQLEPRNSLSKQLSPYSMDEW